MKEYIIHIKGVETEDDNTDTVEMTSLAEFDKSGELPIIRYKEYPQEDDSITSEDYVLNTITIDSDKKITITKTSKGQRLSYLALARNERHICIYSYPFGHLEMGIYTKNLECDINENGCKITADYIIDFNTDVKSTHHLEIVLEEKEK